MTIIVTLAQTLSIFLCVAITTRTTQVRHEWKILIFITTRVKVYFHTPVLAIWHI